MGLPQSARDAMSQAIAEHLTANGLHLSDGQVEQIVQSIASYLQAKGLIVVVQQDAGAPHSTADPA